MTISFDDDKIYDLLLDVCLDYAIDPSASLETETFFRNMLNSYPGNYNDTTELVKWLQQEVQQRFVFIGNHRPEWLQNPEWPIVNNEPMVFVDQIDLTIKNQTILTSLYHDDTSLYIFVGIKVPPVVIVQQL